MKTIVYKPLKNLDISEKPKMGQILYPPVIKGKAVIEAKKMSFFFFLSKKNPNN